MLDGWLRPHVDPVLNRAGAALARRGATANGLTLAGLALGLAAAAAIWRADPALVALALFAASRIADGLDGAVARATTPSDFGGFLDIVCDFVFYGAIPLAFALRDPADAALPAAILLFSFYVNGASLLAYAALAARRGDPGAVAGPKALLLSVGLAEATETYLVFAAMIVWPHAFPALALAFAAVCLATAALRTALAARSFR